MTRTISIASLCVLTLTLILTAAFATPVSAAPIKLSGSTPRFQSFASVGLPGVGNTAIEAHPLWMDGVGGSDLAVACNATDRILGYAGDGNGFYSHYFTLNLGAHPLALSAGWLDSDMYLDLIVGLNNGDIRIYYLDATGKPRTTPPQSATIAGLPGGVTNLELAYLDNDVYVDLLAMVYPNTIYSMKGTAAGSFTTIGTYTIPGIIVEDIEIGDFNNDNHTDFVALDFTNDQARIYQNGGAGAFVSLGTPLSTGSAPFGAAAADLNGDGTDDIAVANWNDDDVSVFVSGSGGFSRTDYSTPQGPASVQVLPFDTEDSDPDMAVSCGWDSKVQFFKGNGSGGFVPGQAVPVTFPGEISAGLANLDGKYDLVTPTGASGDAVAVLRNTSVPTMYRLAGGDRYETAVQISELITSPGSTNAMLIATGADYPDALAGVPLARATWGSIILTRKDALPAVSVAEIKRVNPPKLYILGGTSVVSDNVRQQLINEGYPAGQIVRLAGANRYETAEQIALELDAVAPGTNVQTVFVATGRNFPDALSGAGQAAREYAPILLVAPDKMPAATASAMSQLPHVTKTVVLGGQSAVGDPVANQFPGMMRLSGPDRYATSAAIADYADGQSTAFMRHIFMATGENFPDALAAGAMTRIYPDPLLLTRSNSVPSATQGALNKHAKDVEDIYVVGGTGAVSASVASQIQQGL